MCIVLWFFYASLLLFYLLVVVFFGFVVWAGSLVFCFCSVLRGSAFVCFVVYCFGRFLLWLLAFVRGFVPCYFAICCFVIVVCRVFFACTFLLLLLCLVVAAFVYLWWVDVGVASFASGFGSGAVWWLYGVCVS